jgi:uncharacterized protein YutE (UPF0331/DUF86 family)
MDIEAIKRRLSALIEDSRAAKDYEDQNRVHQGTLGLLHVLYGRNSSRERELGTALAQIAKSSQHPFAPLCVDASISLLRGALHAIQADVEGGILGSLLDAVTGDVLSDLIKLARTVSDEGGDASKNVAAVLAAAAFEDSLRRLAASVGLPHHEKLADVVTALKEEDVLQGSQVGIAQSYLSFRNRALHAKWAEVDRPEVASVLGFTEALLVKHFS